MVDFLGLSGFRLFLSPVILYYTVQFSTMVEFLGLSGFRPYLAGKVYNYFSNIFITGQSDTISKLTFNFE
jgi:hypothetical protein